MLVIHQSHNPFNSSTRSTSHFATSGAVSYHDDPLVDGLATDSQPHDEGDNQGVRTGPAMQPSRLHDDENEWREV